MIWRVAAAGGPTPSDHSASPNVKSSDQSGLGEANRLGTGSGEAAQGVKPIVGISCLTIDGKKVDCSEDPEIVKYAAAKKSNQWKQTKTGKQARNAQLQPISKVRGHTGCVPHPSYEPAKVRWVKPYRKLHLSKRLAALDCNPARCKNHALCHIPPCKALRGGRGYSGPYWKIVNKRNCPSSGCATVRRASIYVPRTHDSLDGNAFQTVHPGTGFGLLESGSGRGGYSACHPSYDKSVSGGNGGNIYNGGWFYPDGNLCNPLHLSVCTKATITHGGLNPEQNALASRSAAILIKRTWCVKIDDNDHAKCLKSSGVCRKTKCYVFKIGRCVLLNQPTWLRPTGRTSYPEHPVTKAQMAKAMKQYQAKQFTKCNPAVQSTADRVISSA